MPNNETDARYPQGERINVDAHGELLGWSKKFGVSPEQLKAAVKIVGTSPGAVSMHLRVTAPLRTEPGLLTSGPG